MSGTNGRCFSGGADGSDLAWGEAAERNGFEPIHFTFNGHRGAKHRWARVLDDESLSEADPWLDRVNREVLHRSWPAHSDFVSNLLRRNYYQVKDSEAVYAVASIDHEHKSVFGGTAWAIEVFKAMHPGLPIYVYDELYGEGEGCWFEWFTIGWGRMMVPDRPPPPTGNWTGIGSRALGSSGRAAIYGVFLDK